MSQHATGLQTCCGLARLCGLINESRVGRRFDEALCCGRNSVHVQKLVLEPEAESKFDSLLHLHGQEPSWFDCTCIHVQNLKPLCPVALLCLCASSSIRYVITSASATTKINIQLNTNSRPCLCSHTPPSHTTITGQYRQHARRSTSRGSHALNQDSRRLRFVQHNRRPVRPSALRAA